LRQITQSFIETSSTKNPQHITHTPAVFRDLF